MEGHRASLLLGIKVGGNKFDNPNNFTRNTDVPEDGEWLTRSRWGHLNGYPLYNAATPLSDDFETFLFQGAMQMWLDSIKKEAKEKKEEPPPKLRGF